MHSKKLIVALGLAAGTLFAQSALAQSAIGGPRGTGVKVHPVAASCLTLSAAGERVALADGAKMALYGNSDRQCSAAAKPVRIGGPRA
jgi:hypothetical protein